MAVLQEYRIGSVAVHRHLRRIQLIGVVPVIIALLLALSYANVRLPLLVLVAGSALSLQLILYGFFEIQYKTSARSRMARWVKTTGRAHFPAFLLAMQKTFFIMTFVLLWVVLKSMTPQISPLTNLCFYVGVALIPFRNLARELGWNPKARWRIVTIEFVQLVSTTAVILLAVGLITNGMGTGAINARGNASPLLIMIWVPGALSIFLITLKFLDNTIQTIRTRPRVHELDNPGHTGASVSHK